LIFDEGGKPENLEKNPCGMRKNNISNKLSTHTTQTGVKAGSQQSPLGHPCHPHVLLTEVQGIIQDLR